MIVGDPLPGTKARCRATRPDVAGDGDVRLDLHGGGQKSFKTGCISPANDRRPARRGTSDGEEFSEGKTGVTRVRINHETKKRIQRRELPRGIRHPVNRWLRKKFGRTKKMRNVAS